MKKILSMLLALVMVISLIPVTASAVEVASGTATASRDSNWTYSYTAPADGTLTITVGDGTTEWASDVMNFSNLSDSEDVTGTEQASYTYDVTAGTKYSIRIFGQGSPSAAITDVPYSIVFTSASGEEEDTTITVKGKVATDTSGNLMTGTDVAVTAASLVTHSFKASADGILTVHIKSASTGWKITGEGIAVKEGSDEAAVEYEVTAGSVCVIQLGCYENWDWATGTISYDILFYETELAAEKDEYTIADKVITTAGEHTITMEENAKITVVTFTPDQTGVYTATAPEGTTIAYCGAYNVDTSADFTNTVTWTCTDVGQSMLLGIKSDAETVSIQVAKTEDYVPVVIEEKLYENKAELSKFELPEDAVLGNYVDVYSDTHTVVLGEDGYYHLDSVNGDVLLIDMNYEGNASGESIILSNALNSDRPVMYAYVTENGTQIKYSIGTAVKEYEAVMDSEGYYPLTEDLVLFYENYATASGIWSYHLTDGYNEECVWLYCCRTVVLPATSGTIEIDAEGNAEWAATADGIVNFEVSPADAQVVIIADTSSEPDLTITEGRGSLNVTAGKYCIENWANEPVTVVWEYVEESEGGDEGGDETVTVLSLGDNAVSVPAGMSGGSWTYTATEAGTLSASVTALTLVELDTSVEEEVYIDNVVPEEYLSQVMSRDMTFLINGVNALNNTVQVDAGDVVTVQLSHRTGTEFRATINLALGEGSGSEVTEDPNPDLYEGSGTSDDPYVITSLPVTLTVVTDTYFKYAVTEEGTIVLTDSSLDEGCLVKVNDGNFQNDTSYSVIEGDTLIVNPYNSGSITVSYGDGGDVTPEGSYGNPYILDTLYTTINPTLEAWNMAYYQYQATEPGVVAVRNPYDSGAVSVEYLLNGSYVDAPISFAAGDIITVTVFVEEAGSYSLELYDPTVAKIGDTVYTSVEDALADAQSGDTVQLVADAQGSYIIITPGVTLDLGSHSLTADYVIGLKGSMLIANTYGAGDGKLIAAKDNVALSSASPVNSAGNKVLPIWMESEGCYQFTQHKFNSVTVSAADGTMNLAFYPATKPETKALFKANGVDDYGLSIIVRVSYTEPQTNGNVDVTREYLYTEDLVKYTYFNNATLTAQMSNCDELQNLMFTIAIVSDAGVEYVSEPYVYVGLGSGSNPFAPSEA